VSNFNWGILGPGGIARAFAADLQLLEGHAVGAVGSRTLSHAQEFAETFGGKAYGSYEELIADLQKEFTLSSQGPLEWYSGCKVVQDLERGH
jgi:predicted dehydrogenase